MPLEWTIKYEPKTFADMVLHPDTRTQLSRVLKNECNVTLYSKPGMGKGTFANVFLKETGCDSFLVNASDKNGIGYIREYVEPFAYTGRGLSDKPKVCIFNEADRLTAESQSALKEIIERSAKITLFWFLTNNLKDKKNKIGLDDAIISRAPLIEFKKAPDADIKKFIAGILKVEGVDFTEKTLMHHITHKQDIRSIIEHVEKAVVDGKLYRL